jgi:hypothetical protein
MIDNLRQGERFSAEIGDLLETKVVINFLHLRTAVFLFKIAISLTFGGIFF